MKGKQFIRKLRGMGVEVVRGRGKGAHALLKYKGRQTTFPIHGDMDLAKPFLKEICKQLGIDPGDVL